MGNEVVVRLGFFSGVFAAMAIWELLARRRALTASKRARWFGNSGLVLLNSVLVRSLVPIPPVGMALLAQERGWGALNNFGLPYWLGVAVGVVSLDCVIYLQHVMFHAVPLLRRIHSMHHADVDLDVTSGLRFHPIEIIMSVGIKLSAVMVTRPRWLYWYSRYY